MALLTTPPYNPWNSAPSWVADTIRLSAEMQQRREQMAATERARSQQAQQQALADQRRAFEFDRRMEFDRARTAADDSRADDRFAFQKKQYADENAPFTVPGGSSSSPSASLPSFPEPALPTGGATIPAVTPDSAASTASSAVGAGMGGEQPPMISLPDLSDAMPTAKPSGGVVEGSSGGLLPFVKKLEGFNPRAYGDFKQTSIGYGTRAKPGEMSISREEAQSRLQSELDQSRSRVGAVVARKGLNLAPNQIDALVSFDYNTGAVDKLLETRSTPAEIVAGMALYNKAGGKVIPGLVNRRSEEAALFSGGGQSDAGSQIRSAAQEIANLGLSKKQGSAILAQVASSVLSRKPESDKPFTRNTPAGFEQYDPDTRTWNIVRAKPVAESERLEDITRGTTYNPDHGTYKREDGSEFFADKGAKGWTQKSFRPSQTPARLKVGDDGKVYGFDADGEPVKPVPEGTRFDKFNPKLNTKQVPGTGLVVIDPDGSTRTLIPEGVRVPASVSKDYLDASQELREAQVDLEAQTRLLAEKPRSVTSWFGGSEGKVADAQKKFDAAKSKVEGIRTDFPQLAPKGSSPAAPAAAPAGVAQPKAPDPRPSLGAFDSEEQARGAGAKSGDIVMLLVNGKQVRVRLN